MRRETLATLLRIRQDAVRAAKQLVAQALTTEASHQRNAAAADRRIVAEAEAALDLGAEDGAVEAYARWLPEARAQARQCHSAAETAATEVCLARTALSLAEAAELAIRHAVEHEVAAERQRARQAEQAELDDIASRRGSPPWI